MEYHKYLISSILDEEGLDGFQREQRWDELEHLSTETLEKIREVYIDDKLIREKELRDVWNRI